MLRALVLLLMAGCLGSAATIGYDVEIDTSVTGPQASLLLALFDNDNDVATELAVTNVEGVLQEGWSFQTGNVYGSFADGDLIIRDGAPSFQYINGYLELFAIFDSILKFTITFETEYVPNLDLALFGMKGADGLVVNLFSFNGTEELTVYESNYVTAVRVGVTTLPEPPALAELMLLLGLIVGVGVFRQLGHRGLDHGPMDRVPHFG